MQFPYPHGVTGYVFKNGLILETVTADARGYHRVELAWSILVKPGHQHPKSLQELGLEVTLRELQQFYPPGDHLTAGDAYLLALALQSKFGLEREYYWR